ncbi:DinB family protein [Bacillus sp. EAC]|uniref:DinB family protein n=1 Tax=Bacillus sp. EAC TaxID=1978338 RepID=UPI000B42E1C4|nr:DinB family protein [Bacillus sp. EAC]
MSNSFVFHLLNKKYKKLFDLIKKCPENKRDDVPKGFNNSIHWQIGHILYSSENFVLHLTNQQKLLPENYQTFFAYGTKPIDWKEEPPTLDLIIEQLEEQLEYINQTLKDKLDTPVNENFLNGNTIGELLFYNVSHVSEHIGVITSMIKVLK